jgi:hypothetical protein
MDPEPPGSGIYQFAGTISRKLNKYTPTPQNLKKSPDPLNQLDLADKYFANCYKTTKPLFKAAQNKR